MNDRHQSTAGEGMRSGETAAAAGLGACVALAVWCSLPPTVIVFNDDFGYLRSIVETLRHGRPWTNDWLEPWAASLSLLAAAVFKLTGSFSAATYGLQSLLAGVAVFWLIRLLRERGLSLAMAAGWSLAWLSLPAVVWKIAEFGPMPLYWTCLLVAVWAVDKSRWWLFGAVWLVAVSSRQSAFAWLMLPIGAWLMQAAGNRLSWRHALIRSGLAVVVGALVYFALKGLMNPTHAQRATVWELSAQLARPDTWRNLAIAAGIYVTALGCGGFVVGTGLRGPMKRTWSWPRLIGPLAALAAVFLLWWHDVRNLLEFEHPYWRTGAGGAALYLIVALALAGWAGFALRLNVPCLLAALMVAGLISLRGVLWEYYVGDLAVLGFLGVRLPDAAEAERWGAWIRRLGGMTAMGMLLWLHGGVAGEIKHLLDHNHGSILAAEPALRSGEIAPDELGALPFGYQGWHLYPHHVAHAGADGGYIGEFTHYLRPGSLRVSVDAPDGPEPDSTNGLLHPGERVAASALAPWSWTQQRRFRLIRQPFPEAPGQPLDLRSYRREDFPLSDVEWRQLILAH